MHAHRVAALSGLDQFDVQFNGLDLAVVNEPVGVERWWRTPVVSLSSPGSRRFGGTAVVWGDASEVAALFLTVPDPVVVVVSTSEPDFDLWEGRERVVWLMLSPEKRIKCEVQHQPGSSEYRLWEFGRISGGEVPAVPAPGPAGDDAPPNED